MGFIFKVSQIYKKLNLFQNKQKVDLNLTESLLKAPPKKNKSTLKESVLLNKKYISNKLKQTKYLKKKNQSNKSISLNKISNQKSNQKRKTMKNVSIRINMAKLNINNIPPTNDSNSIFLMNSKYMNKNKQNRGLSKMHSSFRNKKKLKSAKMFVLFKNNEKVQDKYDEQPNKKVFKIQEYLMTPFEDMDFEDAVLERKRNFFIYFFKRIKKQHILINSFFIVDNIQPRSIKILLFLTEIDLYLLINAMLFNEEYISEIFHIEKKESFFSFVPRSINRYIYTTFSGYYY
jgi:hypothetical protein